MIFDFIFNTFNSSNLLFQKENCQLHNLYPESRKLLSLFTRILLKHNIDPKSNHFSNTDFNFTNHIDNSQFITRLKNEIDFEQKNYEFVVDLNSLSALDVKFAKRIIQTTCELIVKYLNLDDKIIQAFQLIDPKKRNIENSSSLFRDFLLKVFINAYNAQDYDQLWNDFKSFAIISFEEINVQLKDFICNDEFDCEKFWIFIYKSEDTNKFKKLARFFINIMLIPHTNMFVERMFSSVNLIKTKTRSCLEVDSVSSFLKIKSYLNSSENLFEPEDIHFTLYNQFVKEIK